jgi:putative transposase
MARLPRYALPGQPQHIIQRGNNRQVIFASDADFQFFRDAVVTAAEQHGLAIHAYVWMSNHIHLLATPEHAQSISKVFQSVGRTYVQYFNYTYQRTGSLWEGRYRATVVDSETYLMTLMRYIELNPVRAGMVAHPRDYAWSSYARNAYGERGANADWIKPHEQYLRLARGAEQRLSAYRGLFKAAIPRNDLAQIRDCTHKGWALGSEKFKATIEALSDRPASSKGVGRPRAVEVGDDNRV